MKRHILAGLGSLQRPVALMLSLITLGSLGVSCAMAYWIASMATYGSMGDPNIIEVLNGFVTLLREYAIPILTLCVSLAVVNLACAFAMRRNHLPLR